GNGDAQGLRAAQPRQAAAHLSGNLRIENWLDRAGSWLLDHDVEPRWPPPAGRHAGRSERHRLRADAQSARLRIRTAGRPPAPTRSVVGPQDLPEWSAGQSHFLPPDVVRGSPWRVTVV